MHLVSSRWPKKIIMVELLFARKIVFAAFIILYQMRKDKCLCVLDL